MFSSETYSYKIMKKLYKKPKKNPNINQHEKYFKKLSNYLFIKLSYSLNVNLSPYPPPPPFCYCVCSASFLKQPILPLQTFQNFYQN